MQSFTVYYVLKLTSSTSKPVISFFPPGKNTSVKCFIKSGMVAVADSFVVAPDRVPPFDALTKFPSCTQPMLTEYIVQLFTLGWKKEVNILCMYHDHFA